MQTPGEHLDDRRRAGHPAAQPLPVVNVEDPVQQDAPDRAPRPAQAPAQVAADPGALADAADELELDDDDESDLHASIEALIASSASASSRDYWEVQITRPCFRSWRYLDRALRRPVLRLLRLLISGREARGAVNHAKPLTHAEPGLALFESYLPRGWRLLWEETFAYSECHGCWRDTILLWDVCAHDGVEGRVRAISERFRRRQAAAAAGGPLPPRPPERAPAAGSVRRPREVAGEAPAASGYKAAAGEYTLELSALAVVEAQAPEVGPGRSRAPLDGEAATLTNVRRRAAALARAALAGRGGRPPSGGRPRPRWWGARAGGCRTGACRWRCTPTTVTVEGLRANSPTLLELDRSFAALSFAEGAPTPLLTLASYPMSSPVVPSESGRAVDVERADLDFVLTLRRPTLARAGTLVRAS